MSLKRTTSHNIISSFTENMSFFYVGRRALAESAGGVLWSVMNTMKLRPDLDYSTFSKRLWFSSRLSSYDGAGVWGPMH